MQLPDIERLRKDTPTCESLIHFNNAGASLMPKPVHEALINHLALEASIGGYEAEHQALPELDAFYTEFATLLNASPDEIAYVENATRAWDMAFYGMPLKDGDHILTHESEYVSNYLGFLQQAKRRNLVIDLIPSDESGQIDVNAIPELITDKTRLIAITHVPTQGGLVNPAIEVGEIAKAHDLIYLLDACQSAGQIALDVKKLQCDVLTGTGRKFLRGPRGTGFLYVNSAFLNKLDPPFVDLHSATWTADNTYEFAANARRFENWESYVAGRIGLMEAVRYANTLGLANIESRVANLAKTVRSTLSNIKDVDVHDLGVKQCGIVTLTKTGIDANDLCTHLRTQGINTSVSTLTSARLDLGKRNLENLVRASVHYFNTEAEIDRFAQVVESA